MAQGDTEREPRTRPTMNDVAARAGVGLKTVSRVVNGETVRPATLSAVLQAIDDLGYRRNDGAASLRQGSTASIGLVVGELSEPFQSLVAQGVETVTQSQGSILMAASSRDDPERERQIIEAFLARRVDGLVVITMGGDYDYLLPDIRGGMPLVFVDRPPPGLDADTVLADNVRGMREGVSHLISHGHRKVGYFGDRPFAFTHFERLRGYQDALRAASITVQDSLIDMSSPEPTAIRQALLRMVSGRHPVTAVAAANSRLTIAVLRAMRELRHDLAIVGFDDFELADLLEPGITVVAQDPLSSGAQAASLLFRRLAGDDAPMQRILLQTKLIPRGSGERRPENCGPRR